MLGVKLSQWCLPFAYEPVTKGGDVATCSSIIEINNYCQLCSIMYLVYCIQNTIKTYMIKLCASVTIKSIKQIVKVQNDVIFIVKKWDNWL